MKKSHILREDNYCYDCDQTLFKQLNLVFKINEITTNIPVWFLRLLLNLHPILLHSSLSDLTITRSKLAVLFSFSSNPRRFNHSCRYFVTNHSTIYKYSSIIQKSIDKIQRPPVDRITSLPGRISRMACVCFRHMVWKIHRLSSLEP
jgi:hypothetical protein